jgi:hypothetical protein
MAALARGAVKEAREAEDCPPMPHLYRGRDWSEERTARAA